jgi:hypothetical protein
MKPERSLNFCTFRHAGAHLGGGAGSPAKAWGRAAAAPKQRDFAKGMVLPDRIELSTSPLPMECSTTELRQRARKTKNRPKRLYLGAPILATRPSAAQAHAPLPNP